MAHTRGPLGSGLVEVASPTSTDMGIRLGYVLNNSVGSLFTGNGPAVWWYQFITFRQNTCSGDMFNATENVHAVQDCAFSNANINRKLTSTQRLSFNTDGPSQTLGTVSAPSVCLQSYSPPTSVPPATVLVAQTRTPTVSVSKSLLFSLSSSWNGTVAWLRSRSLVFSDALPPTALRASARLPSEPLARTAELTGTASFTSHATATPESTRLGSPLFIGSPPFRGTSQFSQSWTFSESTRLSWSRAPASTGFLTTATIGRSVLPFTVAFRSTLTSTPTMSFSWTQLVAATGGLDVTVVLLASRPMETKSPVSGGLGLSATFDATLRFTASATVGVTVRLRGTSMASTRVLGGLSEIAWPVSVRMNATGLFTATAFILVRETVPIGETQPLRDTAILTDLFCASHSFDDDSPGKGGSTGLKFQYWMIIVAGLLVIAAAAYLIYWRLTRVVVPECPSDVNRTEWFDHQDRERLREMTVDFQNPIALESLQTLMELSEAMTIAEMDAATVAEMASVTINEMDAVTMAEMDEEV